MSEEAKTTNEVEAKPADKTHAATKAHKISQKTVIRIIGDIASVLSVIMYVSYITQIAANLSGNPGVPWQPLAAFFNCLFWSVYGIGSKPRLWPIIIANVPGIFLAGITFVTCFIH